MAKTGGAPMQNSDLRLNAVLNKMKGGKSSMEGKMWRVGV